MIEKAVEPTLADDGELASLADWGAKYVGAVARADQPAPHCQADLPGAEDSDLRCFS